jgi:hypothetical protein
MLKMVDDDNLTESDDNQDAYLPVAKGADDFLTESDSDNCPECSELAQENISKVNSQLSECNDHRGLLELRTIFHFSYLLI